MPPLQYVSKYEKKEKSFKTEKLSWQETIARGQGIKVNN